MTEPDAFDEYHELRDRASLRLFDVVDKMARMRWSDTEIVELILELSGAMADEVDTVTQFDASPMTIGGQR